MTRSTGIAGLGLLALCCVMVFCAMSFAGSQAIWVDESTQLSGLSLGFREQWLWLSGQMETPFAVPSDRMPPVSYWVGTIWSGGFGLTEGSMRALGITMGLCAAPALFLAGRLAGGLVGGVFAVAFLFTSPSFIIQTVEIRAYPIFFCLAAWATYVFIRLVAQDKPAPENRLMIILTLILVVTSYTHFYGVVMSSFVFMALLAERLYAGKPIKVLLICAGVGGLLLLGILPFVTASVGMTGPTTAEKGGLLPALADTMRLVFRLLSSPVLFANQIALLGGLSGIALLGLCLAGGLISWNGAKIRKNLLIFLLPLVLGLTVLTLIRVLVWSFAVLAPHYNVWMLPLVSVTFAFAFALDGFWTRRIVRGAALCVIAAQLAGLTTLMSHKSLYTHGPAEEIAESITDPATSLVIHDASSQWGQTYFPLVYLTGGQMAQWLSHEDGSYQRITKSGVEDIPDPQGSLKSFKTVLRVHTTELDSQRLADITHDPEACQVPRTYLLTDVQAQDIKTFCAYFTASYTVSMSD